VEAGPLGADVGRVRGPDRLVKPRGAFRFEPGQFGWFAIGRSRFSLTQHPFSFSSSAERDEVEVAIKALGDFTAGVKDLQPGTTVYVDGPHGVSRWTATRGPASASSPAASASPG
jgi:predicted ferric reductase